MIAGENYTSSVLRVDITARIGNQTQQEFNWFAKIPGDDIDKRVIFRDMKMEEKEILMYKEVI